MGYDGYRGRKARGMNGRRAARWGRGGCCLQPPSTPPTPPLPPPAPPAGHLDIHIKDGAGKATYLSATARRRRLLLLFFFSAESAIHLETMRRRSQESPRGRVSIFITTVIAAHIWISQRNTCSHRNQRVYGTLRVSYSATI